MRSWIRTPFPQCGRIVSTDDDRHIIKPYVFDRDRARTTLETNHRPHSIRHSRHGLTPLAQLLPMTVVPKFTQSSYCDDVLKELFPNETEPNAASNDVPPSATKVNKVDALEGREQAIADSLEAVRNDPEAVEEKIADAVAVSAAAARAEGKQKRGSAAGKEVRPRACVVWCAHSFVRVKTARMIVKGNTTITVAIIIRDRCTFARAWMPVALSQSFKNMVIEGTFDLPLPSV